MRWGEKETCLFVNLYLKHEVLWNTRHVHYRTKVKRLPAYRDIIRRFRAATGVLLTEMEVKIKIKNLRSTYSQELAKIRERANPDGERYYKPALKWFERWHNRFQSVKNTDNDTDVVKNRDNDTSDFNEPEETLSLNMDADNYEINSDPFESHPEDDYLVYCKSEPHEKLNDEEEEHTPGVQKRKVISQSANIDRSARIPNFSLDALRSLREDEFDVYGKYIATQLRSMGLEKALRVQLQIQNIVSEARLSDD